MVEIAHDQTFPWVEQISVFLPNKVGSLERIVTLLDREQIRVCGFSILDSHDHAVVRLVVDRPPQALIALKGQGRTPVTANLLAVALPVGSAVIVDILHRLLRAELNVHYAYSLLVRHGEKAIVVLHADNLEEAAATLRRGGFELISQKDLEPRS